MKIFVQKYYNEEGEERWQVINDTELLCDDILTEEAAILTAKFYATYEEEE
jgi:hypothetical protein